MKNRFSDLGISPPLLKSLEDMGFEEPTEVQSKAIPHILNKEDLIVMSKTGSGKTAVFGVPLLQLTDPQEPGPQGLILTPTRELAVQINNDLKLMSKYLQHRTTAVFGQHNMNLEIQALGKGPTLVTGTPGRVYDHIDHGNLKTGNIRYLVLDEADRMLDMGFIQQVIRIIRTLPRDRVTLLFSATIPAEVRRICRDFMKQPATVEIASPTMTVDTTEQKYYRVNNNEKNTQLYRLLLLERPESALIFCNTRLAVDRVQRFLSHKGIAVCALHGDIPQGKRLQTIQRFKEGHFHLLVATDVASRGIHVEDLALVINYDVPTEKDSYVHRIGRTGRAGKVGKAVSLVTGDDIISLYEIEEHIGVMIPQEELPSEAAVTEQKTEIEKWLEANALRLPEKASGDHAKQASKKQSVPPRSSQKSQDRSRSAQAYAPGKKHPPQQKSNQDMPAEAKRTREKPRSAGPSRNYARNDGKYDNRRAGINPAEKENRPDRSAGGVEHPSQPGTAKAEIQAMLHDHNSSQEKTSLLGRLLRRIFGK